MGPGRLEKKNKLFLMDARLDPNAVVGRRVLHRWPAGHPRSAHQGDGREVRPDRRRGRASALVRQPVRERQELYALHEWLLDRGLTTIMTVKSVPAEETSSRYAFLDFMADCVIHVDQRVTAQITTRRLRVIKYRGSGYGRNEYPFIINERRHQHHSDDQQRPEPPRPRCTSVERRGLAGRRAGRRLQARDQHPDCGDGRRRKDHAGLRLRPGRLPARRPRAVFQFRGVAGIAWSATC